LVPNAFWGETGRLTLLFQEIKQGNLGVQIEDMDLSILLYADDIVLIAENEVNLQNMLNIMSSWCCNCKWRLTINNEKKKTQVVQFREKVFIHFSLALCP